MGQAARQHNSASSPEPCRSASAGRPLPWSSASTWQILACARQVLQSPRSSLMPSGQKSLPSGCCPGLGQPCPAFLRLGHWGVPANSCQADKLGSTQPCLSLKNFSMRLKLSAENALQLEKLPRLGLVATNMVWLTEMKDAAVVPRPDVAVSGVHKVAEDAASFQLTCKRTAAMVALDTSVPGTFSENLLTCAPDEPTSIGFSGRTAFNLADLVQTLTVTSLADTLTEAE